MVLSGCHSKQHIHAYSGSNYTIGDSTPVDNDLESIIEPFRVGMELKMGIVIGNCTKSMLKNRNGIESELGNWVADIIHESGLTSLKKNYPKINTKNCFTLINKGGIRASLNKGNITKGHIFELMPFDNEIVIIKLSPDRVTDLVNYIKRVNGQPVSGIIMKIQNGLKTILIQDEPYDFDKDIYIVTSDYLAKGGDKMNFFKSPMAYIQTGILIRDALLTYVENVGEIEPTKISGRIQFIE